ncbi:unnamed protein product [Mytilus coruscus]|uniref:Integrase catalytic domain-containing protein n=1 Tax=Mytilus coruscus TaxID=42192 RepID=A0A6J8AAH0_MYTCO|nr:unnamed protein product [Mytilus coruscus]
MEEGNSADLTETNTATAAFPTNAKVRTKPVNRQMNVKSCIFCNESHAPVNCTKIIEHKARISIVKRGRLCFNCLGHHNVADCKSHQSCRKCEKRQHTSLCKDEVQQDEKPSNANVNISTIQETQHNAKETATVLHSQTKRKYTFASLCSKVTGRPYPVPDPPPLPADRLHEDHPFTVTGVDFAGPLHIRTKEGQNKKVYICLFTCASTRAVHLEIVQDLSQNAFILAFCRFTSRKSLPKVMISDNVSMYVAGAKEIEHLTKSSYVTEKLNSYGTTWRFIPKRAPWFSGWWERLIGLTKNCIKKVSEQALVDNATLNTIITEVQSILNDRPLTYVSSDPTDNEPLIRHIYYMEDE